jgi:hypothetical protein
LRYRQADATFPSMSTLAEIEFAVTQLPRPDKAELLRFVAAQLREPPRGAGRTGAELARLWPALPHLTVEEAAEFERDLELARAVAGEQQATAWE